MPYKHAGEYGDVLKHLPLCDVLANEKPLRYHETNSAYSGYEITENPNTEYGILGILDKLDDCDYLRVQKENGIDNLHYTGSPGLAIGVLQSNAIYYFHDIEREALEDIARFSEIRGLERHVNAYCGDSIQAFLCDDHVLDEDDFVHVDPYTLFDNNELGNSFFDVFEKAVASKAKTMLWYGYGSLYDQNLIWEHLEYLADKHQKGISSFDIWQKCMTNEGYRLNPGVPGCGIAFANLSSDSIDVVKKHWEFLCGYYAEARYHGEHAPMIGETHSW